MYYLIFAFLFIIIFFMIVFHFRKKNIIKKICCLSPQQRCLLIRELAEPFGYCYDMWQDVFTNTQDAWQKNFGYTDAFDKSAPFFNMIFDYQPVYFNYIGKTWLIEFWKGQYGINTGCETGIYHADKIIPPDSRKTTIFSAAEESEYLPMTTELFYKGELLAQMSNSSWWQTIFLTGQFSEPYELSMRVVIRFPNWEMCDAFTDALAETGYEVESIHLCHCSPEISFCFGCSCRHVRCWKRIYRCYVQCKNKCFCRLYRFITRPFCCTCDKLLYLYYYLPVSFRCILRMRRFSHRAKKKNR